VGDICIPVFGVIVAGEGRERSGGKGTNEPTEAIYYKLYHE
jgi:hypothetical protein